jgi:hypothetical protein
VGGGREGVGCQGRILIVFRTGVQTTTAPPPLSFYLHSSYAPHHIKNMSLIYEGYHISIKLPEHTPHPKKKYVYIFECCRCLGVCFISILFMLSTI